MKYRPPPDRKPNSVPPCDNARPPATEPGDGGGSRQRTRRWLSEHCARLRHLQTPAAASGRRPAALRWQPRPRRALRAARDARRNAARRAMLLRRRLRRSRRARSYLDGEQGRSKAVVLDKERKCGGFLDPGALFTWRRREAVGEIHGGRRQRKQCAVHTFVHHERFAFGFEGECASVLVQGEALQSTFQHAGGL